MSKEEGGPAFPVGGDELEQSPGMTLRDWLAGQALTGFIASYAVEGAGTPEHLLAAKRAYQYADAMLQVRDQ